MQTSTPLGTASIAPYRVSFTLPAVGLALSQGTIVTLRAVASASTGHTQVATLTGTVKAALIPPTGVVLAATVNSTLGPAIPETALSGQIIGLLSSVGTNPGATYTYALSGPLSSSFAIQASALVVATGATFSYYVRSVYPFNITTTDSYGLNYTTNLTVYITHVNLPPTAISINNSAIPEGSPLNTLVGVLTVTDRDSSTFSMQLAASGGGSFYVSGMFLYVAKILSWLTSPQVVISVTATDGNGLSYTGALTINVTWVNQAPTALALSSTQVLALQPAGTVVGTLTTTDRDVQTYTYTLLNNGGGSFAISGANLTTAVSLNYLATPSISIIVMTTDSGTPPPGVVSRTYPPLSYSQSFIITVINVPQPPAVADTVMSVPETAPIGTIVGTVNVAESAYSVPLNFTINTTLSDPGYNTFRVQECSGTFFVNTAGMNYDVKNVYVIYVNVAGQLTTLVSVTINVVFVNQAPEPPNYNVSVNEHSPVGFVVLPTVAPNAHVENANFSYAISAGNAAGFFAIDPALGAISMALSSLDYQNLPVGGKFFSLVISVSALFASAPTLTGYCTVTINVNNVPEPPHVTNCVGYSVVENSVVGTVVSTPMSVYDEDGNNVTFAVINGSNVNLFHMNAFGASASFASTIPGPLNSANLTVIRDSVNGTWLIDYETTPGFTYPLVVSATDAVGQTASFSCPVAVIDINEAPWSAPNVTFYVAEDSPAGTRALMANGSSTIYVWDQDFVDHHTWTVAAWGPMASSFFTLASDSTVSVLLSPVYFVQSRYWFVVTVTDKGGLTWQTNVTVVVLDVPEAPVIAGTDTRTIAENVPVGSDVYVSGTNRVDICATDDHGSQVRMCSVLCWWCLLFVCVPVRNCMPVRNCVLLRVCV